MAQDEKSGRILAGRYRLRRPIGSGAHGTVYCAEDLGRSGRHVAFKLAQDVVGGARGDEAEEILRRFQHPSWATVLDAGSLDDHGAFQVTRLVPGRSLDNLEGPQPIEWVWRLLEDGARVLGALHRHNLIHYDVTPGNLILNTESGAPHFVLTDGGLAHVGPVDGVARGTPMYMAPEVTEDDGHDHRADLYSLGLVAFRLATGRDPIDGGAGEILRKRREHEAPRASTVREDIPPELDTLLAELLSRAPRLRPHDAFALLERLDSVLDRDVPAFLHEEGLAAAEGGSVVGREEQLARFDESLTALGERRSAGGRRLAQAQARAPRDSVLLLRGRPGCGASRLAEEMTARARTADVPCLLMAGRDQSGDRRGPLRHLTDGLVTLAVPDDQKVAELRLDLGAGRAAGRAERAHAGTRAVEQFLRAIEDAAERTPFVLVVQDFQDLPPNAQEAVRVLSRHLLARRESGGSPRSLSVLLVVDLGGAEPESLLLPDAQDPDEPVLELAGEDAAAFERICQDRFPGFDADEADVARIVELAEGLPGVLVALLGEACRRGDLGAESGRWHWNVNRLDEYEIQRGVTPAQADALRKSDDDQRRLLAQLSLVDTPLRESLVADLWKGRASGVPSSQLVQSSSRDGDSYLSPLNLAVRMAVVSALRETEKRQIQQQLLDALNARGDVDATVDRARLAVELGEQALAISALYDHWSKLAIDSRAAAQGLILRAIETNTVLLESAERRQRVAEMLEYETAATAVARLVAAELPAGDELETAEAVAATLRSSRKYAEALEVLERAHPEDTGDSATDGRLWTAKAFVLFDLHQADAARECVRRARACLRRVRDRREKHPLLLAEFLIAESQARFLREESSRAMRALRAAYVVAKKTSSPVLRAKIINNMGIVENQCRRTERSITYFERALRIKRVLGDVSGAVKTTMNLGRLRQAEGALVKSAALYQAAASSARRHAQPVALSRALLLLAQVYDQQLNTRLAATTLERAVRVAELAGLPVELARAVWDLAPILAATGDADSADEMLRRSANSAYRHVTSYARAAHHVATALTAMHLGLPDRAALACKRAMRHQSSLYPDRQRLLDTATTILRETCVLPNAIAEVERPRPEPQSDDRYLWRSRIWFRRALREGGGCPPPLLGLGVNRGSKALSTSGRERRLITEMLLRLGQHAAGARGDALLASLEQRLAHTGECTLQARALALRSCVPNGAELAACAQYYSRAIQLVDTGRNRPRAKPLPLPNEHQLAFVAHERALGNSTTLPPASAIDQHSLAHRLLIRSGYTETPDNRVASALRRVLEATGRMNAGAGLDDLLQGMTLDTLEITGAERTCVVLVDAAAEAQVRVATSASSQDQDVDVEDLSQTVIQRVLESQTPLLLHDVFDDQELMGRPSITDLSLRSILCVPMLRSETLYGVMYADSASAAGSFDQVDLEVLSLFAEQAAGALETHRLVADVQNSMDELKAMQERLVKGERLRTMGELSSGVAHEFNNLLTSILARVQLINLTPVGPELKQDLDLIEKACLDAAEVVRRLQNFTRHQRQGHFVRLDLAEICRDAVEFLRPLWSTRRRHGRPPVHVQLHVEEGLMVNGDPTELREVVTNLLKNALDVLADGGEVTIAAHVVAGVILLRVLDDGPGMPPDVQARAFDPFFTTKGERGTGLGLCLSQQIVERHGGEITVESSPGEGTAFHVELPMAGPVAQINPDADPDDHDPGQKMRVLVVDDDANVREPLVRYLEQSGYEVCSAADGRAGLEAVAEHNPNVVITDVAMPEMDGLELCETLRRERSDLPIVVMSGWSKGVDATRARRAGATAMLGKPFALRQVAELLSSVGEDRHEPNRRAASED